MNMTPQMRMDSQIGMAGTKTRRSGKDYEDMLCGIYWTEKALAETLPEMIDNAEGALLKQGLKMLLDDTGSQVTALEKAFGNMGKKPYEKPCVNMSGILKEGRIAMQSAMQGEERDAAIIEICRRIERYSAASYKTLMTFCENTGEGFSSAAATEYAGKANAGVN